MNLLSVADLFRYGRGYLAPAEAVSLYRYVEHLIEVVLARKYGVRDTIEIGPGRDSIFKFLPADAYASGTVVDYNEDVLRYCEKTASGPRLRTILLDVEDSAQRARVTGQWDYVVSNGVLEHLKDDTAHVQHLHELAKPGGIVACTTVLGQGLFNDWDRAVGHYRRYTARELAELFRHFSDVQVIRSSLIQELVRPLFFSRINHLLANTSEENNRLFGDGVANFSRPPYERYFGVVRYLMPIYLLADWAQRDYIGGIAFVLARK